MRNPIHLLKPFANLFTIGLLLCVPVALTSTKATGAETPPSVESILDEAIDLVGPSAKVDNVDSLLAVAIRQAKVRSCEKAKDLFKTAADSNERWAKEQTGKLWIENHIGFLNRLLEAQQRAGCGEEMTSTAARLRALYHEEHRSHLAESAGDELTTARHNLQLLLNLGNLYVWMKNLDAARGVAPTIIQQIRAAKWRPSLEFGDAAAFLVRMGHDDDALEVVNRYDQFFEARQEIKEDFNNRHYWIYRVGNLAEVAAAQAAAGHTESAKTTFRRAIEKARSTPVARLTKLYGMKTPAVQNRTESDVIGEGEALQSAGLMRIVWLATSIGETALALEALDLASPFANEASGTEDLIRAFARKGEVETARKLLDRFRCSRRAIVRVLLEKQDWAGALEADKAYPTVSCCERTCDVFESSHISGLAKARTFVDGEVHALAWARKQPKRHKVSALLEIVDALLEKKKALARTIMQ
jgi:tetratricopeptide (TPR) repeat protein